MVCLWPSYVKFMSSRETLLQISAQVLVVQREALFVYSLFSPKFV